MRKHLALSLVTGTITLALSVTSAFGVIATPHVAGSMDGWAGPNSYVMTETFLGSGIWTRTINGLTANGRYEWKVTDGTWANNIPGPNSWLFADGAGSITITYDSNVYGDGWSPTADRLGLSTDPGAWTAVGSFLSELGGSDWNNADPFGAMTSLGGGIYELTVTLPAGNYDWKGVVSGSWDSISWDQRSVGTANWNFNTDAINDTVIFRVNALDGTAQISVVPEPSTLALATLSGLAILVGLRRRS